MIKNKDLFERFFRYVKIDTQSDGRAEAQPSTAKQHRLAELLSEELKELGIEACYDREHCYVYAVLPGRGDALGFVAHMDTSPAASGKDVKPRLVESYDGGEIELGTARDGKAILMTPADFPELKEHAGEDLIVTDGTTLLGADDKAGVAEIMNMLAYYAAHPEEEHRTICAAFTPDEEVGRGTENFDVKQFAAKEAYTVDGGKLGELEYECFNAAEAVIEITGRSVHPGDAKNKMKNAAAYAVEFHSMMPADEVPEHTEGYEGFYYLEEIRGDCEQASLTYIIRDHDRAKFEARKAYMERVAVFLNEKYGEGTFSLSIRDQYRNMADVMKDHLDLIDRAKEVLTELGVEAQAVPIRGGTDGAALTFMGIPCPNLCTGGYNFHGRFEYASVQEMETCAELLIRLAR